MVPIENQERPNIKSVYTCSNCEKALFDGDDDHPRWNFCPMCGQEIDDLKPDIERQVLEELGLETAEDGNYDIIPLFSVERPE